MTDSSTVKIKDIPWRVDNTASSHSSVIHGHDISDDEELDEETRIKRALKRKQRPPSKYSR